MAAGDGEGMETCSRFTFQTDMHVEVDGPELLYDRLFNHTATLIGRKIYLLGGFEMVEVDDDGSGLFTSQYAQVSQTINWVERTFVQSTAEVQLPPRQLHTATLVNDKIYVTGGATNDEEFADVWVLDVVLDEWEEVDVGESAEMFGLRYGHAAEYMQENNEIIVFGGSCYSYINSSVIALSLQDNLWHEPKCVGTAPPPRFKHASCMVGRSACFFGGQGANTYHNDLFLLHPDGRGRYRWSQPRVSGWLPAPRYSTSISCIGTRLFSTGGKNQQGSKSSEVLVFDFKTQTWCAIQQEIGRTTAGSSTGGRLVSTGSICEPVYQHRQVNLGTSILLIGGLGPFIEDVQELRPEDPPSVFLGNAQLIRLRSKALMND